jgi:metal-responsive CopG/Arc/MetJ family transcriptional regulator
MSQGTTRRSVRIDEELWEKAQEVAAVRGDNLSDIIRKALEAYIKESES